MSYICHISVIPEQRVSACAHERNSCLITHLNMPKWTFKPIQTDVGHHAQGQMLASHGEKRAWLARTKDIDTFHVIDLLSFACCTFGSRNPFSWPVTSHIRFCMLLLGYIRWTYEMLYPYRSSFACSTLPPTIIILSSWRASTFFSASVTLVA